MNKFIYMMAAVIGSALLSTPAFAQDLFASMVSMKQCQGDNDCIVTEGMCRGWEGINRENETQFAELMVQLRTAAKCTYTPGDPPLKAICKNNRCQTKN